MTYNLHMLRAHMQGKCELCMLQVISSKEEAQRISLFGIYFTKKYINKNYNPIYRVSLNFVLYRIVSNFF